MLGLSLSEARYLTPPVFQPGFIAGQIYAPLDEEFHVDGLRAIRSLISKTPESSEYYFLRQVNAFVFSLTPNGWPFSAVVQT